MGCHAPETWGGIAGDVRWNLVVLDWPWRLAFRVGFRAARLWWRLRRPAYDGAAVAVWLGGRVLAVQPSVLPGAAFSVASRG